MSRGIIEAQTLRTEQFEFEARTSDPADAQPGEYWFRVDQTSTNPDVIAELRRQDASGVTTCPIFAASEESNLGTDVTRGPSVVLDDGSVGFIVMTTGRGVVGSPRAVNSAGTQYVSHNALELSPIPIPDSVVYQVRAEDFASPWPFNVGGASMTVNGLTSSTFSNGRNSVSADGTDDYGLATGPASLGSQESFGIAFTVQFLNVGGELNILGGGSGFATGDSNFNIPTGTEGPSGSIELQLQSSGSFDDRIWVYTTSGYDDGSPHAVVINKSSDNNSGVDIYVDDMTTPVNVGSRDGGFDNSAFGYNGDVAFYARVNSGSVENHAPFDAGIFEFNSQTYTQTQREEFVSRRPEV